MSDYAIEVVRLTPQYAAVVHADVAHDGIGAFVGQAFGQVMSEIGRQGAQVVGMPFSRYEILEDGFRVEAGFPTSGMIDAAGDVRPVELPGGEAVTTMHVGPYDQVAGAYYALEAWQKEHGRAPAGGPWEEYFDGPEVATPRTRVVWPIQ